MDTKRTNEKIRISSWSDIAVPETSRTPVLHSASETPLLLSGSKRTFKNITHFKDRWSQILQAETKQKPHRNSVIAKLTNHGRLPIMRKEILILSQLTTGSYIPPTLTGSRNASTSISKILLCTHRRPQSQND